MLQPEVVSHLIYRIYHVRPDLKLPKTAIHKILFKARATLPEGDPVREKIPFYWYNYGPYSEVVESSIDTLKARGILAMEETSTGKYLLKLNKKPAYSAGVNEGVSAVVEQIVRGIDPYNLKPFVNRIYRHDAPYGFMPLYKIDFLAPFEEYITLRPAGQSTLNRYIDDPISPRIDRLENVIYECEAELIEEPLFDGFNDEFSSYVSGAGKAFDIIREDEDHAHSIAESACRTAMDIWIAFAKGVRILDRGHDKYYDRKLVQWEREYRTAFSDLVPKIRSFNRKIRESASLTTCQDIDERGKRILSSLIEGYFS
ncbi:MAG: hypothetical protein PHV57_06605 [Methanomicrobiaceae archaeon]|nr:hypothetical protein [Methanomicrobiaceae archaeon]